MPFNQSSPPLQKRPWRLDECNLQSVRDHRFEVAILPLGATEPHNLHLPYGTDSLEAEWISNSIAEEAWKKNAKVVVYPTIPYGTETNLRNFPLAMNLNPSTLFRVIEDLVETTSRAGIKKLLLLNSHGGNDFKPLLRELYGKTDVQLFLCNWFQMIRDAASVIFEQPDDHAGEMETSMILAYRPDLVARQESGALRADAGDRRRMNLDALEKGWVSITRPWHLLTTNSGSGNPHAASAEKGSRLMAVIVERLAPFLVELAKAPIDDSFPFQT